MTSVARRLRLMPALALLALPLLAAPADAATTTPRVLPKIKRTLTADVAKARDCMAGVARGAGVASQTYTAPDDGVVATRLKGPETSDWDLAVFDAATGRQLAASNAFGSNEVANAWLVRGQQVRVQACRRKGDDARVPLTIGFTALELPAVDKQLQLVEVPLRSKLDAARLQKLGLDTTDHSDGRGQELILHSAEDARKLSAAGFTWKVKVADLVAQDLADRASERRAARSGFRAATPGGRTSYRTLAEYQADLKQMVEQNPGLVRPVTLPGKSWDGRDITGVEIATNVNRTDDGRPVYVQIGVHHAREWPAGEASIEFGLDLLQRGKAGEARWKDILDNARTMIVPIMNVDGFNASRSAGTTPNDSLPATPGSPQQIIGGVGYRRKNCRPLNPAEAAIPCEARVSNDNGVDNNRNYGEQWGGPGTSSMPNDLTYHGPGPFSEPETVAVRTWLTGLQPTLLVTNHTFTGLILRPPGTSDNGPAPDEDRMRAIGDAMARETDYISQYSYQLYDTTGTTDDWLYGGLGSYSFTPEIGKVNFHPSYVDNFIPEYDGREEIDKDTGQPTGRKLGGLREAFVIAGLAAFNPDSHSIIRGTAPAGRTLRIKRDFVTVTSSRPNDDGVQNPVMRLPETRQSTLTVPADGTFTWHTAPSTRPFESNPVPWTLTCENSNGNVLETRQVYVARAQSVTLDLACGGQPAPVAAQQPSAETCDDRLSPLSRFLRTRSRLSRRRGITLRGRVSDRGCTIASNNRSTVAGVRRVRVSIARTAARSRCRFLRADGTFSRPRSCRLTSYLSARGTTNWSYSKRMRLPRGEYKIWAQALDRARNIERKDARRNFLRLRVR